LTGSDDDIWHAPSKTHKSNENKFKKDEELITAAVEVTLKLYDEPIQLICSRDFAVVSVEKATPFSLLARQALARL
jgi:hypothetical protein